MIVATLGFAMRILVSSFKILSPVSQVLQVVLPYGNMAANAIKGKINFNTKHLRKGDPLPPYNGKLRLYNMRYCPYAQRTVLALNAKQIDYEVVNINLMDKPEWLPSKSALGKVPALEIKEGVSIYESLVTVEYLDDVYPQRPLLPKDPVMKAYDKIIVETCGSVHTLFYKVLRNPESVTEENVASYQRALAFFQDQLQSRGTKFLGGSEPGYADYMTWPWFERVLHVMEEDSRLEIDAQKYKLLVEYLNNMLKDPVVSQYLVPKDVFFKFMEAYTAALTIMTVTNIFSQNHFFPYSRSGKRKLSKALTQILICLILSKIN